MLLQWLTISDQYAFRPTGSKAIALIALHQKTTTYSTVEPYVVLFSLVFTKAFDTVRHSTLVRKLSLLDIPYAIYNVINCFLEDRSHVTRYAGRTSEIAHINASVVIVISKFIKRYSKFKRTRAPAYS